jgi:hypothetical protein
LTPSISAAFGLTTYSAPESGLDEIAQELVAELARPAARADHGDRRRLEDRLHRCIRRLLRTLGGEILRMLGRCDGERNVDGPLLAAAFHFEAEVEEDVEHALIFGEHLGLEALDAVLPRGDDERVEQVRGHAAILQAVGDGERDLRHLRPLGIGEVMGDGDDLAADLADHAEVADVVDVGRRIAQRLLRRADVEEAHVHRVVRELRVHGVELLAVLELDGPQVQRAAVAEDDVGFEVGGVGGCCGHDRKVFLPLRSHLEPRAFR